jgi:hypothetical protein
MSLGSSRFTGVGFCWLGTTGTTTLTASTFAFQNRDVTKDADIFEGRDSNGEVIGKYYYNQNQKANLTYLVIGATLNGSASVQLPTPGDVFVTTDASLTDIAGNWYVQPGAKAGNSNKDATMVSVPLARTAGGA